MITEIFITPFQDQADRHQKVKDYIRKNVPHNAKVLDLGGASNCWGSPVVNHVADLFVEPKDQIKFLKSDIKIFSFNFEHYEEWSILEEYCKHNGLFDFVICSHTLEDLHAPFVACQKMNKIAKAGYIAIPNRYQELKRFETHVPRSHPLRGYRGYHHHRWMYRISNSKLIGYPKQSWIEYLNVRTLEEYGFAEDGLELSFFWKDNFDFEFVPASSLLDNREGRPRVFELLEADDSGI